MAIDEIKQAMYLRKPYLKITDKPINNVLDYNDRFFDPLEPALYNVFLADNAFKIMFTVKYVDNDQYLYEISNFGRIYLDGIVRNRSQVIKSSYISANPDLVQTLFDYCLKPYGIILDKVDMHNYTDFDSVDFHFETQEHELAFKQFVDETLKNKTIN